MKEPIKISMRMMGQREPKSKRGYKPVRALDSKVRIRERGNYDWEERLSKIYELFELIANYLTTRISPREVMVFFDALAFTFSQGLPIITSIKGIAASSSPKLRKALENLSTYLLHGSSLYSAMAKFPWIFDPVTIKLVQIGELTGNLAKQLNMASKYIEEKEKLRMKIASALQYPAVLSLMMIVVFGVFVKYVFPILKTLAKPEGFLSYFFYLSEFLGNLLTPSFLLIISLIGLALYLSAILFLRLEPEWVVSLKYRLPFIGDILLKYDLIVLFFSLENLYRSGVSMNTGLRILGERFKGPLGDFIKDLNEALVRGDTMSEVFESYKDLLPDYAVAIAKVGEESGHIGDSFAHIVKLIRDDVEMRVKILTSLLEPIIMIGMGILVLFIFLSILPIFMKFYRGDIGNFSM